MSDDNIQHVDFGGAQRESARRLARLLGLVDDYYALILKDPKPFLDRAHDEIVRLREAVRSAQDTSYAPMEALLGAPVLAPNMQIVHVEADEWKRMMAMKAIIQAVKL